jgi:DGQHR domain-containing protein
MPKRRSKRRAVKLDPASRLKRRIEQRFRTNIRTVFGNVGFEQVPTRDENILVAGVVGDLDGVFLLDNVLVITEDTTLATSSIGDHLRKKAEFFRGLARNQRELFKVLSTDFPRFAQYLKEHKEYAVDEYVVRFVYCSRYGVDEKYRTRYQSDCQVLSYSHIQYFLSLSRTIRRSARFELFKFLGIELAEIGPARSSSEASSYQALLLSEVPSGFPPGHKLVSFLVDPATLLERAYVLRTDSWRDQDALYQRLLVRGKIASMREYLVTEGRVFVNNVIVTLPHDTDYGLSEQPKRGALAAITPVKLTVPKQFNAIGIVDGQHRVFAYHEGTDKFESQIAALRKKQHLLVTGIIYPPGMSLSAKSEFEAKLFLEINDKQKRVRGDLKQSIERIVHPYSAIAIAKAVIERMAQTGPLTDLLEVHFFDSGKIRTASIVSYGLRHIVAIKGDVSLFGEWPGPGKAAVRREANKEALTAYINYCATQLNLFVAGFKAALPPALWTTNLKESRALTTTTINGLIFCMRLLIDNSKLGSDVAHYRAGFQRMQIGFSPAQFAFRSSHWRDLGAQLYSECFS